MAGASVYIDSQNLNKMARDENYRATIFGLIKREIESVGGEYKFMNDGKVANVSSTAVHMSISSKNDGIVPYRGFSRGDVTFSRLFWWYFAKQWSK